MSGIGRLRDGENEFIIVFCPHLHERCPLGCFFGCCSMAILADLGGKWRKGNVKIPLLFGLESLRAESQACRPGGLVLDFFGTGADAVPDY